MATDHEVNDYFVACVESDPNPLISVDRCQLLKCRKVRFLFFDKRPELIQLAFVHVVILNEMLTDLLTVTSGSFKNKRDRVFVDVKDPGTGANAVAFG